MEPVVDTNFETNVPGLFLAGSIIEALSVRIAANQGHRIASHIAALVKEQGHAPGDMKDLVIAGAGPAGLNAALTAQAHELQFLIFDQYFMASTVAAMPEDKVFDVHYKNVKDPPEGNLWYETSPATKLHGRWQKQIKKNRLAIREHEAVRDVFKDEEVGGFRVKTTRGVYRTRYVLLSIGKSGYPRRLNVIGELELRAAQKVHYKFRGYTGLKGKNLLVMGGGNAAAEAAVRLCEANRVTLSYRKEKFDRLTPKNLAAIKALEADGKITVFRNCNVLRFENGSIVLFKGGKVKRMSFDEYFVLIGYEIPIEFLVRIGVAVR